jgi:quercetin dioxygenase-like cupin family protein
VSGSGFYPPPIYKLPLIDIKAEGVIGYLLQGQDSQTVFYELSEGSEVPPHSHEAQWGVMLDGEMELTVDGRRRVYTRGETYFIPTGTIHSGRAVTDCKVLDVFFTPARYGPKR